jgi:hypothetical protein
MTKNRSVDDLPADWPSTELVERLVEKSAGSFIFASTLCKAVNRHGDLDKQLKQVSKRPTNKEGRLHIDGLYRDALAGFSEEEISDCLSTIILLQNPLSLTNLSQLLCRTRAEVNGLLTKFHSVLAIPREDKAGVVRIIHASFHDFLVDEARCSGKLLVQPASRHSEIAILLFNHLIKGLRGDTDEDEDAIDCEQQCIDGILAYACRYWADHLAYTLQDGRNGEKLVTELEKFIGTRCSRWTETLRALGSMDITVTALRKASRWYLVGDPIRLYVQFLTLGIHVHRELGNHD